MWLLVLLHGSRCLLLLLLLLLPLAREELCAVAGRQEVHGQQERYQQQPTSGSSR